MKKVNKYFGTGTTIDKFSLVRIEAADNGFVPSCYFGVTRAEILYKSNYKIGGVLNDK